MKILIFIKFKPKILIKSKIMLNLNVQKKGRKMYKQSRDGFGVYI